MTYTSLWYFLLSTNPYNPYLCLFFLPYFILSFHNYIYIPFLIFSFMFFPLILKGTVAWDGFFAYSIMYLIILMMILDLKFFWFWSKIRRDRLNFMSIGVFSIYGKIFLAHSPNTFKCFKRILRTGYNTLGVFRRRLCIKKTTVKSPLSPCTLKVFWRHYRILLNTFAVFSI